MMNTTPGVTEPTSISPLTHFDNPFSFQPNLVSGLPNLPGVTTPIQQFQSEDIHSTLHSQPIETSDYFSSQRSSTSSASSVTPQIRHQTTSTALVRNAMLVNNVQSQSTLQRAIHSLSKDFRLRGQSLTIESVLSPLIYRSNALKHSIFANYILKVEQAKRPPLLLPRPQDPASLQERHYNTAVNHLQTTLNDPQYTDANVGASLILAFYSVTVRNLEHWTTQIHNAAEQIRIRGRNLDTNPLSLHTKFLFNLFIRTDTVGSSAIHQPANTDPELLRIVYSGVPISNPSILPCRMELELLLAEASRFQCDCATYLPIGNGLPDIPQEHVLRRKYHSLVERLGNWQGLRSDLIAFEETEAGDHSGVLLPPVMGSPLICV